MLTIFCNISIVAQSNFVNGTIITNNEDTLVGFINNKQWVRSPHFFEFKKSLTDTIRIFNNKNTKYISFSNNNYICVNVSIDKESNQTDKLKAINRRMKPVTEKVFLQTLFSGKVNLYYYIDEYNKEHFYVQKDTLDFDELIYYRYIVFSKTKNIKVSRSIETVETYKGQLIYYLNDCPSLKTKITNSEFRKSSIIDIFKKYYDCTNLDFNYSDKSKRIYLSLISGVTNSNFSFTSSNPEYSLAYFKPSTNLVFGLGYLSSILKKQTNWKNYSEITFNYLNFKAGYDKNSPDINTFSWLNFNVFLTKASNLINYYIPINNKISCFLGGGASLSIIVTDAVWDIKQFYFTPLFNTGINFNNLTLELNYSKKNIVKNTQLWYKGNLSSFTLNLNYKIPIKVH
ncbi:MAG: hypothetical protein GXO79_02705 [Chlorobi bacterium]|nr:hypothetical protein [Chlorobiota bacterium]